MRRFEAGQENPGASSQQRVVEELRLEGPEAYARVEAMALLRRVAVTGAAPIAPPPARAIALQTTLTDIRARLGLFMRADLDRWMARNDLDVVSMETAGRATKLASRFCAIVRAPRSSLSSSTSCT